MAVTHTTDRSEVRTAIRATDQGYQAFLLLRTAFTIAPIVFGLDKFFNVLVDWPTYLAPWIDRIVPGTPQGFMYVVGAIEVLAGVVVALRPRFGGYLVAAWLGGIIVNLLTVDAPRYYDIALRDLGLAIAALALARLAAAVARGDGSADRTHPA